MSDNKTILIAVCIFVAGMTAIGRSDEWGWFLFFANDYYELSHDKIKLLYDEYKKLCNKLIEVDRNHDK